MANWSLKERINRIFANCNGVDVILIANTEKMDPNFQYLTGFAGDFYEGSIVLVKRTGATIIASELEYGDVHKTKPNGMAVVKIKSREQIMGFLKKELQNKKVGMNYGFITQQIYARIKKRYKPAKTIDVSVAFARARQIKDRYEIQQIKKASAITKKAMKEIQSKLKVGITEKELAREFDYLCASHGSDGPAFSTIVSFGKNTALIHHSPSNTRLQYGDMVMIDAGSKVNNYCSDVTRTFIFGSGKARIRDYKKKRRIIEIVKEAQSAALKEIRKGVKAPTPHNTAYNHIAAADAGEYKRFNFPYALGHPVGLEVHDAGDGFYPKSKLVLAGNMVITDEPGIYVPGFGGARIEDDILITKKGPIVL